MFSWSQDEKKRVMDAVEDYLESCAQVIVDIEVVERSENLEVSLRYVLQQTTGRGSIIFQLFNTPEKTNHFVASRRRWLESQGRDDARQDSGRNDRYDLGYQGARAKVPPCPNSTLQTPLPQQSSSSAREEEDHWDVREERQRRRIAFENLAKGMLRYLDNSNGVKVGITELQERAEVPLQDERKWPKYVRKILARRGRIMYCQLGQMGGAAERLSRLGKKMSRHKSGNTDAEQKTRHFPECDRRQACTPSRLQDQIIEEKKRN